jgi:hypothetical protein
MKVYEATYHLLSDHYDSLNRKSSVAVVKQILQGRSEQIYNEDVMKALLTKVVDIRDAGYTQFSLVGRSVT